MSDMFGNPEQKHSAPQHGTQAGHQHTAVFVALFAGLVIALGIIGYLGVRIGQMNDQMAQMQTSTEDQLSKLSAATTSLLEQRLQTVAEELSSMKTTEQSTSAAVRQTRAQAQKQGDDLRAQLEQQQKQTSDQITDLKDTTTSGLTAVNSDVSSVKTDVSGVRNDVTSVKTDVASTQQNLNQTTTDLKRVMGDMGVMSGLIATNAKDLSALRALGERNYVEFDITRKEAAKKLGEIGIMLKKADPKSNRYTVDVFADDKHTEKRDRTINEPVQVYLGGNRLPSEIVVNQVKKDEIVGYISTPKMTLSARAQ